LLSGNRESTHNAETVDQRPNATFCLYKRLKKMRITFEWCMLDEERKESHGLSIEIFSLLGRICFSQIGFSSMNQKQF
jgi:hypothetical protein